MLQEPTTYSDIEQASVRIAHRAHKTPVLTSTTVNQLVGGEVFFKCENFQKTGSFKFRGAFNTISQLEENIRAKGVITYSSGNHAQAVALSSKILNIPATIIMPEDAPQIKLQATRGYGANVVTYDRHKVSREELGARIAAEKELTLIPPYDHPQIIAGQGTATKELIEQVGNLDYLFVCCGGGGLLAGATIAASHLSSGCKVIGVEPKLANDGERSFQSKTLQTVHNPDTIADGARTPSLGKHNFPIILEKAYDITSVEEKSIAKAMIFLMERMKLVIEPTGALSTAAVLMEKYPIPEGKKIGVLISGGNVDIAQIGKFYQIAHS